MRIGGLPIATSWKNSTTGLEAAKGSVVGVNGADSISQMEMIDRTYQKAGWKLRPSIKFTN